MTTLVANVRRLIPTMPEIKNAVQHARTDARTLWLPVGTIAAVLVVVSGALIGAGMWIARTGDRAATTTDLASQLQTMNTQLSTMQGSINALMTMQSTLAETKAEVGSIRSRLDEIERRGNERQEVMNTWIMTTRERLKDQGYRNVPEYRAPD